MRVSKLFSNKKNKLENHYQNSPFLIYLGVTYGWYFPRNHNRINQNKPSRKSY